LKRVQIALLSTQALEGRADEETNKKIDIIEKKLIRMVFPENIIAVFVIALMVYAYNPF
jgi:hypothetical protein